MDSNWNEQRHSIYCCSGIEYANALVFPPSIGAGESGKSTILKQMKLIYAQGFNKSERLDFKPVIFSNIVQSFKTISEAMAEMGFEYDSPDNEVCNHHWASGPSLSPHNHCMSLYTLPASAPCLCFVLRYP